MHALFGCIYSPPSPEQCTRSRSVLPCWYFQLLVRIKFLTTSWMRNRKLNCSGLSGSNSRQCFVSACLDEPNCGSWPDYFPPPFPTKQSSLYISLCTTFLHPLGKPALSQPQLVLVVCVCMWRIHLEGIGVIKVAEYIFLYLHSHVFLGHDD